MIQARSRQGIEALHRFEAVGVFGREVVELLSLGASFTDVVEE